MRVLLKNGYTPKLRPSGHDISDKFGRDNRGSIPPNLLALANTESNGTYQKYCQEHGLPRHPARFPSGIPEHFIRMLTDRGDLVVDPFAGSCVTGEVAERLGRRWICCEIDQKYLEGACARFLPKRSQAGTQQARLLEHELGNASTVPYKVHAPCSMPLEDETRLPADGGHRRPSSRELTRRDGAMVRTRRPMQQTGTARGDRRSLSGGP